MGVGDRWEKEFPVSEARGELTWATRYSGKTREFGVRSGPYPSLIANYVSNHVMIMGQSLHLTEPQFPGL